MSRTILIFAGPSGGHLFPALAFAEEYKSREPASRIFLVTSIKAQAFTASFQPGIFEKVFHWDNFPSTSGISLRTLSFLIKLLVAHAKAFRLIRQVKPDLCAGFGSYVTFPGIFMSACLHIPAFIHEQNVVPGKATRWLAPYAKKIAVSFDRTRQLDKYRGKLVFTGLPVRRKIADGKKNEAGMMTDGLETCSILVMGGSQGASFLNKALISTFSLLSPEEKKQIAVIHISGKKDYEGLANEYQALGVKFELYTFFENMNELFSRADIAVTRAGANTLFELALYGLPSIVVPYPHASGHQIPNAEHFAAEGGMICEREETLTPAALLHDLRVLINEKETRKQMSESLKRLADSNAASKLYQLAIALI